jgi:hypothetical protein
MCKIIRAMRPVHPSFTTFLAIAALVGFSVAGCGDSDGNDDQSNQASQASQTQTQTEASQTQSNGNQAQGAVPSQEFEQLVSGLKNAALAEGTYGAIKRARDLSVPERSAFIGFCETVWQLEVNSEQDRLKRLPYIDGRIRNLAVYDIPDKFSAETEAALDELLGAVDLESLDPDLNHDYKKACYQ